jgi:hypothetical protein
MHYYEIQSIHQLEGSTDVTSATLILQQTFKGAWKQMEKRYSGILLKS